jgi:glycosyltransferase involved in cell wall biosynthesis
MMKILLVSLYFVEYAVELANALGEKNQVHLVLSKHRVHETISKQLDERITNKVSYTLLYNRSLRSLSILKTIRSIFKILMTFRCDVIHLQESANPLNLLFTLFSFRPVVATIHDVQLHPGSSLRLWRFWLIGKIRRYGYSKIIVHGDNLRQQFVNHYKRPAQDVFVVPHGCLFSFLPDKERKNVEEPHAVLFFGRIEEYKGLRYLIEAEPLVREVFPDFKVIVAGRGADMRVYKSILLSNPHFEVHDRFIPNNEIASFFQRASVVVLPYIEASQSGIVAMAFAFGKPVVATDVGSLGEMVEDGKSGILVPPRDVKKLADAIIYLLQNKDRRKKMGREALELAKTTLSWEHVAYLTEEVYQTVLRSNHKRPSV